MSRFHLACGSFRHTPAGSDLHVFTFCICLFTGRNFRAAKTRFYTQKKTADNVAKQLACSLACVLKRRHNFCLITNEFHIIPHSLLWPIFGRHTVLFTHTTVRALWRSYKTRTAKGCKFKHDTKKMPKPSTVLGIKTKWPNSYIIWWYNYCVDNKTENEGATLLKFN